MESQTGGEKPPFEQKIRLGPPRAPKEGKIPDHGASYRIWQTGTTGRGKAWVVTLGAALGAAYGFFRSEQQAEDAKAERLVEKLAQERFAVYKQNHESASIPPATASPDS